MKTILFILTFMTAATFAGFSQTVQAPVTAEQKADEIIAKMQNTLSLTEDQTPKIKGITIDRINKVTDARKKYGADRQRVQSASKMAFDEWESQLKGILTLEQYNKYVQAKNQF